MFAYDAKPPALNGRKSTNTGAVVGGVVGGVAAVVACAMAFWWFVIRKQLRRRKQSGAFEPCQVHLPQVGRIRGRCLGG